jgi:hypothetical protein
MLPAAMVNNIVGNIMSCNELRCVDIIVHYHSSLNHGIYITNLYTSLVCITCFIKTYIACVLQRPFMCGCVEPT